MRFVRRCAACLVAVLVPLGAAGLARADGDPASDTLYQHKLFEPYFPRVAPAVEAKLLAAIGASVAAGKEVRVALIASRNDLGGLPYFFGKPTQYARFLDTELQFVYTGRVLVVMPQGAGLATNGRLVADKSVTGARPQPGMTGLARTAIELVGAVSGTGSASAATAGRETSTTTSTAAPRPVKETAARASSARYSPKGVSVWIATGIAVGAVALILAIGGVLVSRRRRSLQL